MYLKTLPPIVNIGDMQEGADEWWGHRKEFERVLKMYRESFAPSLLAEAASIGTVGRLMIVSPAIEAFGTHRLIFGSSTALPLPEPSVSNADKVRRPSASLIHPSPPAQESPSTASAAAVSSEAGTSRHRRKSTLQMVGSAEWEASNLVSAVDSGEWYAVLRKAVTELGEGKNGVDGIFGANARGLYQL